MAEDLIPAQQPAFLSEWNFVTTITAPPTTAQVRMNSNNQKNATRLWIHNITANGIDATANLEVIKVGDMITLRDTVDKWQQFAVSATPIKQTDYWEYPVTWQVGGTIPMTATKVAVELPFTSVSVHVAGVSVQASRGNVTVTGKANVDVSGEPMQALSGDMTITGQANVSLAGASMQLALGQQRTVLGPYLHVDGMEMQVSVGGVIATGQIFLPDQAYPSDTPAGYSPGMTLRQWYAGQALQGFISNSVAANLIGTLPIYCFKLADSMIEYELLQAGPPPVIVQPVPPAPARTAPPPQQGPITVSEEEMAALMAKEKAA